MLKSEQFIKPPSNGPNSKLPIIKSLTIPSELKTGILFPYLFFTIRHDIWKLSDVSVVFFRESIKPLLLTTTPYQLPTIGGR